MTFQYENNDIIIPLGSHFWIEKKKQKKEKSSSLLHNIHTMTSRYK